MPLDSSIWQEIAIEQYAALSIEMKRSFDVVFNAILDDPKGGGSYEKATDRWTAVFADGQALLTYAVNDQFVKVIVLRILST